MGKCEYNLIGCAHNQTQDNSRHCVLQHVHTLEEATAEMQSILKTDKLKHKSRTSLGVRSPV